MKVSLFCQHSNIFIILISIQCRFDYFLHLLILKSGKYKYLPSRNMKGKHSIRLRQYTRICLQCVNIHLFHTSLQPNEWRFLTCCFGKRHPPTEEQNGNQLYTHLTQKKCVYNNSCSSLSFRLSTERGPFISCIDPFNTNSNCDAVNHTT